MFKLLYITFISLAVGSAFAQNELMRTTNWEDGTTASVVVVWPNSVKVFVKMDSVTTSTEYTVPEVLPTYTLNKIVSAEPHKLWIIGSAHRLDTATLVDTSTTGILAQIYGIGFSWNSTANKIAYIWPERDEVIVNSVRIFPDILTSMSLIQWRGGGVGPYSDFTETEFNALPSSNGNLSIASQILWLSDDSCAFIVSSDLETSRSLVKMHGLSMINELGETQQNVTSQDITYTSSTITNEYATSVSIISDLSSVRRYVELPPL